MQGLKNLFTHCEDGIQRGHWFLENHADPVSPDFPHLAFTDLQKIPVLKKYFAGDNLSRRIRNELNDGVGRDAFAAA